jgi:hypothetical protein
MRHFCYNDFALLPTLWWIFFRNFVLGHASLFYLNFSLILGSCGDWEVDQSKEDDGRSCKTILTNPGHDSITSFRILKVFLNLITCLHLIFFLLIAESTWTIICRWMVDACSFIVFSWSVIWVANANFVFKLHLY